jgi:4-alpha-glucanotransferase
LLESAAGRFSRQSGPGFEDFCAANAHWLDDYALFMALKQHHGWWPGPNGSRERATAIQSPWPNGASSWPRPIAAQKFIQFAFDEQWRELRDYARARHVRIMGDLPIYVSHDSADVWANRQYFQLDAEGNRHGGVRRASGLFQRDRTAVGKSDLSLGRAREGRLRLVAGSISRGI